ncbi:MAG: hypothetical protein AB7R90_22050 [Reyranellaceae bacterium]
MRLPPYTGPKLQIPRRKLDFDVGIVRLPPPPPLACLICGKTKDASEFLKVVGRQSEICWDCRWPLRRRRVHDGIPLEIDIAFADRCAIGDASLVLAWLEKEIADAKRA